MLWAMAGALDPWPEGQDWRDVAAGDQRLPLLLAVDDPSAGEAPAGRRRRKAAVPGARAATGASNLGAALGAWAPGLPFEEGPGDRRGDARDGEPDGDGGVAPAGPRNQGDRAAAPKTKSRPKAGS